MVRVSLKTLIIMVLIAITAFQLGRTCERREAKAAMRVAIESAGIGNVGLAERYGWALVPTSNDCFIVYMTKE